MGTSSLENQDRLGRESAVALNLDGCWVRVQRRVWVTRGPKYKLDAKIAACVFVGKTLCLFYVVYFDWAEPSLP